jgi:myo-inositol-1(or 4)-monophosphatase
MAMKKTRYKRKKPIHMNREITKIILRAGKMVKNLQLDSRVLMPKGQNQFYTQGDLNVESYIINKLKEHFPDHGFDSEELGKKDPTAEYIWILDPIDGTYYFAKDVPFYTLSLALSHQGKIVLGVVYCPEFDRMYCATIGDGATLNGRTIRCDGGKKLENAHICLEVPSSNSSHSELKWAMRKMHLLMERAYRVRIIGVGSLGLCFCASGGFDAYVNLGSMWKLHDIAAGQIIVQEAGGEFSFVGKDQRQIVAGPSALCSEIRTVINL